MKKETEYFLAAADTGSITGAAEKLYVGQPAVSRGIASLEKTLGVQLFIREKTGVTLTEAGRIYDKYARYTAVTEQEMKRSIESIRRQKKRIIPVAMVLNASVFSGEDINRTIEQKTPEYYLQIDNLLSRDMIRELRAGKYRYAVCPASIIGEEKDIRSVNLYECGWMLVTPKEIDLSAFLDDSGRLPLRQDILEKAQLILQDQGTDIRREIDELFCIHDIRVVEDVQSVANTMQGLQKAENGDGSVIISENLRFLTDTEKTNTYRLSSDSTSVTVLAYMNNRKVLPQEKTCINIMCRYIRRQNTEIR